MSGIKETWNNLPKSVKIGGAIIAGAAAGVIIAYAAKEVHNRYYGESNTDSNDSEVVLEDVAVIVNEEADVVVVVNE